VISYKHNQDDGVPLPDPERWLQDYGDYLFKYAKQRLRDAAHSEDVVQETFVSALKARERYAGLASEKTWLTSILKRKIIDFIRTQVRESTTDDIIALSDAVTESGIDDLFDHRGSWIRPPQDWGNPYKSLNTSQFFKAFEYCFGRLKPSFARAFSLKEVTGNSNEEICNELGITTTNFSVQLYRARMSLRLCLEHYWPSVNNKDAK